MKNYSVGLVDHHPIHALGVQEFLTGKDRFDVVAVGHSTNDISVICARYRPDFLLTEIDMGGNPFQEILDVAMSFPSTKIIVLTDDAQYESIVRALAGRVRGYVLKSRANVDLIRSIDLANSNNIYLSPEISQAVMEIIIGKHKGTRIRSKLPHD